jgi:hypothetical protein
VFKTLFGEHSYSVIRVRKKGGKMDYKIEKKPAPGREAVEVLGPTFEKGSL